MELWVQLVQAVHKDHPEHLGKMDKNMNAFLDRKDRTAIPAVREKRALLEKLGSPEFLGHRDRLAQQEAMENEAKPAGPEKPAVRACRAQTPHIARVHRDHQCSFSVAAFEYDINTLAGWYSPTFVVYALNCAFVRVKTHAWLSV